MLIDSQPDMHVVFEAAGADQLLSAVQNLTLDALLIDHRLSKTSGEQLVATVNELFFDLQELAPRMVVTAPYFTPDLDISAIRSGASDLVAEESGPELLLSTIREVSGGVQESFYLALQDQFVGSGVVEKPNSTFNYAYEQLSDLHKQVLKRFVSGLTDSEIAALLNLSQPEVGRIFVQIKVSCRFATRAQLALALFESGRFSGEA
jgi:DNA-binding NarL/FixJ family response regulator